MNNNRRILLFGRDPGGAQAVKPLIEPLEDQGYRVVVYGQDNGLKILPKALPLLSDDSGYLRRLLKSESPALLVTGTSGEGFAEKHLWECGRTLNIPSLAVLDNWVNYGIRFSSRGLSQLKQFRARPDIRFLPTEIAVMDELAKVEMMEEGIPAERITIAGQPYFDSIRPAPARLDPEGPYRILFVSEPIEKSYGPVSPFGYNEKTIFQQLVVALRRLEPELKRPVHLKIQLHPREEPDSFDLLLASLNLGAVVVEVVQSAHPQDLIAESDLVLGMGSTMLLEAALRQRPLAAIQIGLVGVNPCMLCRANKLDSWDTPEKLELGLRREVLESSRGGAINFAVEPAIPTMLRIVHRLCQSQAR